MTTGDGGQAHFIAASIVVGGSNFIFHILVSRLLGPRDYGAVSALLNVVTAISIPLGVLTAAVVQEVVARRAAKRPLVIRGFFSIVVIVACGVALLFAAFSPLVASFLALSSVVPVLVLSLWFVPTIASPVLTGVLMGELRFKPIAFAQVLGAFVRLGAMIVLALAFSGVVSPMVATVLGVAATMVVLQRSTLPELRRRKGARLRISGSTLIWTIVALAGYSSLLGLDTVLARHLLPAYVAGQYAAAATAGRIAFFLPGAISTMAFPYFVADRHEGRATRRPLLLSAVSVGVLGLVTAAVMAAVPHLVVEVMFGRRYLPAVPMLRVLAFEAAVLGVINVFSVYLLARRSIATAIPWVGVVAAILVIELSHAGPMDIAYVMLAVCVAVLVAMAIPAFLTRANPPGPGGGGGESDGGLGEAATEALTTELRTSFEPM